MTMDQIVAILTSAGVPAIIGVFSSGLLQFLKLNPNVPLIEEGKTWINREALVLVCLIVQLGFDLLHHDPVNYTVISSTFLSYFAASAAYTHLFQNNA